ncbi:MAG: arylsulfatase [Rubripirellula sp.]
MSSPARGSHLLSPSLLIGIQGTLALLCYYLGIFPHFLQFDFFFMIRTFTLLLVTALVASNLLAADRPNIIFVLADDLGYGDLGCYGQRELATPNLDRMASQGIKFTRHYAGSTVCAPSRCVLLTGKHIGHASVRGNQGGLIQDGELTIAEMLREAGYATGCVGKWGVGHPPPLNDPARNGFEFFYGYVNMFHAHNFYPEFIVRDGQKVPLGNVLAEKWKETPRPGREGRGVAETRVDYVPDLVTQEALRFVERHQQEPFFLYYALNVPHANNEGGKDGMEVPSHGEFADRDWPKPEKGFASMMRNIDRDIGKLLAKLKALGIDDHTIVFFSSDNGPHQEGGHQMPFFDSNGRLLGMKRDLYEGGIRVPLLVRWPGKIPAGSTSGHVCGFQDLMPTLAELAGTKSPALDGISYFATLVGDHAHQQKHPHLYWEFGEKGGKQAVLKGKWKGVRLDWNRQPHGPLELYDLENDPTESMNVADANPSVVEAMAVIMQQEHVAP